MICTTLCIMGLRRVVVSMADILGGNRKQGRVCMPHLSKAFWGPLRQGLPVGEPKPTAYGGERHGDIWGLREGWMSHLFKAF